MFLVTLNIMQFAYDIHSLVKAFYPKEEVKVVLVEESSSFSYGFPRMDITFADNRILAALNGDEPRLVSLENAAERAAVKNSLKRFLYDILSKDTGIILPWGTLTGIRPTKIAMNLLEEGKSEAQVLHYMQETYYTGGKKGSLAFKIAKREQELLSGISYQGGYSLYIGIPFCPTTCLYCSFTSNPIAAWKHKVDDYLDALDKEIDFVAKTFADKTLNSVYIGGGTPTTLEPYQLDRLLGKLYTSFSFASVKEFTVEAGRADSITREKLRTLQKHGVTRISVNPQTMKEETLKIIGRQHTVLQVKEAFFLAREEGFTNINMDLILGLPGETKQDVAATMEEIKRLNPDSLTVHSLAVKRASKLHAWIEENGIAAMNNTAETMDLAAKCAKEMGMEPYYLYRQKNMSGNFENVGYARPGSYGIYNILMMEDKQSIAALGAGSISKAVSEDGRIERDDNVKDVKLYLEKIDEMIERKRVLFQKAVEK